MISSFLSLFPKPKGSGFVCTDEQEDNMHKIAHIYHTHPVINEKFSQIKADKIDTSQQCFDNPMCGCLY